MNTPDLVNEAISLPVEERIRLVDALLQTLNQSDAANAQEWNELARRRLDDMDAGRVAGIPGETVFEKALSRVK
ncbi:MAG: addiction module protein [Pseudomonadota bacterium]